MQVAFHQRGDAVEFLDDALRDFFAATTQQHMLVALAQHVGGFEQPVRGEAQRIADGAEQGLQQAVHRRARAVEDRDGDEKQDQPRQQGVFRPEEQGLQVFHVDDSPDVNPDNGHRRRRFRIWMG